MIAKNKPQTISEYITAAPRDGQKILREMHTSLRKAAPGAEESIKWGNPVLSYKRILFAFAAYKDHVNLMPTPSAVRAFKKDLVKYKTGIGSIQFPLDKPLPTALVRKIAAFRVKESKEKDVKWM